MAGTLRERKPPVHPWPGEPRRIAGRAPGAVADRIGLRPSRVPSSFSPTQPELGASVVGSGV